MICLFFFASNFAEAARVLLEYGAEIDAKDENEHTATMAAGALGHYEVLEVLLGHHLLNLHVGVSICSIVASNRSHHSNLMLFQIWFHFME